MSGILAELASLVANTPGGLAGLLPQIVGAAQGAAGGGLPALLQQFEAIGLSPQVESWVSHGENLPITAEHVTAAIPAETLAAWSETSGVPHDELPAKLAEILPHVVDQATPEGKLPPEGQTPDLSALQDKLSNR